MAKKLEVSCKVEHVVCLLETRIVSVFKNGRQKPSQRLRNSGILSVLARVTSPPFRP